MNFELVKRILGRPFTRQTFNETIYLFTALPASIVAFTVVVCGLSTAVAFAVLIVGIVWNVVVFWVLRGLAQVERLRLKLIDPRPLPLAYDPRRRGIVKPIVDVFKDPQSWKDLAWMTVLGTFGFATAVASLALWWSALACLFYPAWAWTLDANSWNFPYGHGGVNFLQSLTVVPLGIILIFVVTWINAGLALGMARSARALLGTSEERMLRSRVTQLEETRADTVAAQSSELSRIERDLHDGAQATLVSLAMNLGMAETKIDDDPDATRSLITEAREDAQRTLQELRDLVRGIGPTILRDRGLEAALAPLAARSPIPVHLDVDLPLRVSEPAEIAAYFVISESLANAIKHSHASELRIGVASSHGSLRISVSDDGSGGADLEKGEGLQGLKARLAAIDGGMTVSSPAGGPTTIEAWMPCV